jgi:hypothetical protein
MKLGGVILRSVIVLSSAFVTALAVAKENPYQSIIDRNAFGLKPPPPPPTNIVQETPPLTVKLTGVTSLGGEPKAFFQMTEPGPGKQPKWPPAMTKGEKLDGVEVLEIDVDKGEVKIKNGTIETTLNFEKDGIKSAGAAAPVPPRIAGMPPLTLPPVQPGAPGAPGVNPITRPMITPPAPNTPLASAPNVASPNRSVTVTGGSGTPGVTVTGGAPNPGAVGSSLVTPAPATRAGIGLTNIPTRQLRVTGGR